jgi:hypothetical protein
MTCNPRPAPERTQDASGSEVKIYEYMLNYFG